MNAKEDRLNAMALAVLVLEVKHGHLKWKVTDLSKRAACSRTLVYQYLGATKPEILRAALRLFLSWFYGIGKTADAGLASQVVKTRAFLAEHPEPILFYQKWRVCEGTWIFDELCAAERDFRRRLRLSFPQLSSGQITLVHAVLHGLVTAPFLNPKTAFGSGREMEQLLGQISGLSE